MNRTYRTLESTYVIDCGTLIDGVSEKPIDDACVVVENGRIAEVGMQTDVPIPDGAEYVDHSDTAVIPGMIDAHVHVTGWRSMNADDWLVLDDALGAARATTDLKRLLASGFTTVRDVGSRTDLGLRKAIEEGEIPGPRIYTSELGLSQTAGHEDVHHVPYEWVEDRGTPLAVIADGEDECRKETRKRIRKGVDLIKIQTTGGVMSEKNKPDEAQYTPEEIRAITEEAHRVNIPVAAHAQHSVGVKLALENGVDTIEHGFVLNEESIELFLETDAIFVPTYWAISRLVEHGAEYDVPEFALRKATASLEDHIDSLTRTYEAGVPIALGTDLVGAEPLGPHGLNAEEAKAYVRDIGMTEMEAIQSATSIAARTVTDDHIGSIESGDHADMVVLGSGPLDDIEALSDVEIVYKGGEAISPNELTG